MAPSAKRFQTRDYGLARSSLLATHRGAVAVGLSFHFDFAEKPAGSHPPAGRGQGTGLQRHAELRVSLQADSLACRSAALTASTRRCMNESFPFRCPLQVYRRVWVGQRQLGSASLAMFGEQRIPLTSGERWIMSIDTKPLMSDPGRLHE